MRVTDFLVGNDMKYPMSKLLFTYRNVLISIALIVLVPAVSLGSINTESEKSYKAPRVMLSDETLENRLRNITSMVDYEITAEVRKRIKEYTLYTKSSENILGRVMLYFPLFETELHKRGLPDELKYVAVVESMLKPEGTSFAGAAGLWQIMKSTGRWLGLEVNHQIDERRDPQRSTEAALDYLKYLHEEFGDWTLAIAAYNCGPGNMRKAIRRSGSRDYWKLRGHLPKETQQYIPRIVAAAYLMNYYHLHNLQPNVPSPDMRYTTKVEVEEEIKFTEVEKQLGLENGTLRKLNPSIINARTSDSEKASKIYIPASKYEQFLQLYLPVQFNDMMAKKVAAAQKEKQLMEERTILMRRDTVKSLETIVVNFIESINHTNKRDYHIPSAMRSKLSYLRA